MKQLELKAAREKRGMTMETLAELAGINKATISKIETGVIANPGYGTVVALELALRLRRGSLVFGQAQEAQSA